MSSNKSALLILYLCFALLTLLLTGTALTSMSSKKSEKQNEEIEDMMDQTSTLIKVRFYSCFTSALLLLYSCFPALNDEIENMMDHTRRTRMHEGVCSHRFMACFS